MTTETLTEEQKMAMAPGIVFADGPAGRRARVAGTGLDVDEIINAWRFSDHTVQGCHDEYWWWLPIDVVERAVRYYELFPEEIDAWLAEGDRAVEEAEAEGRVIHVPLNET
jgi:hypothetical protein